jgi:hypothetical protein
MRSAYFGGIYVYAKLVVINFADSAPLVAMSLTLSVWKSDLSLKSTVDNTVSNDLTMKDATAG